MAKLIPWLFLIPPALVALVALATLLHGRTPKGRALKHFRVGGDHVHAKAYDKAEAEFRAGLELWPDHPPTVGALASLLVGMERFEEGSQALEKAMKFDPNDQRLKLLQGRCAQGLGNEDEALEVWNKIPDDSDIYPDAMAMVADVHEKNERLEDAIASVEKAISKSSVHQARPYKKELKRLKALLAGEEPPAPEAVAAKKERRRRGRRSAKA